MICMDRAHEDDVFDKAQETVVTEVDEDDEKVLRAGKKISTRMERTMVELKNEPRSGTG